MAIQTLTFRITDTLAFTIVRQRIFDIIEAELLNQQALAVAASADPTPYEITPYQEKYNPWQGGQMPLVNVTYDTASVDTTASSPTANQQGEHFYNIDLYYNVPSEEINGEVVFGDNQSQLKVQAGGAILYQILMADLNTKLQFPDRGANEAGKIVPIGFLSHRQVTEMITHKPTFGDQFVENVTAFRIRLKTVHLEEVPRIIAEDLEGIDSIISRQDSTLDKDTEITIDF